MYTVDIHRSIYIQIADLVDSALLGENEVLRHASRGFLMEPVNAVVITHLVMTPRAVGTLLAGDNLFGNRQVPDVHTVMFPRPRA